MRHDGRAAPLYRLFFALKPTPVIARRTDHFVEGLAPGVPRVAMDRQHMTLGISADRVDYPYETIKALLRAATAVMADPFDLPLDRLSLGGRSAALRPSHRIAPLHALQAQIATTMQRAGVASWPDWTFSPHQTLFYRDGPAGQSPVEGFCWRVEDFVLICSHVGRTRHDLLGRWPLRGGAQYTLF